MSEGTDTLSRASEVLQKEGQYLFPSVKHMYAEPIVLDEGEGTWVRDTDGREYLDLFSGILTTSLGHCHPHVQERVTAQMRRLGHTSTLYASAPQAEAAERLAAIAPGDLSQTFYTNSGTEAIETAISLARVATGRTEIVALRLAYHGRSSLATGLTAHADWRPLPASQVGITHALSPYSYRCPFRSPCDDSCVEKFAHDLEEVILTTTNGQPAAFLAETIQGVGGYVVPPPGYFQAAAAVIRKYGGLFICDEVQAGFGRTGSKWFGIEHWDVVPDIMVMAKGIASGFPVGATITRPEIAQKWTGKTISTYGGNPICMAAHAATLEVMVEEDVPTNAAARGAEFMDGLRTLQREYSWIGEVRGMGLMIGVELVEDPATKEPAPGRARALLEAARAEGVLIGIAGMSGNVLRVAPSLLISAEETREGLERLGRACEVAGASR
jgi:alanine-glyoxylate transaminase / (R)-3-amino-2-methylpropionate-pyruvate transaminase